MNMMLMLLSWTLHIKDEMALQYGQTLSDCIKGEEWKIYMITENLDCINGISESNLNEEEN